MKVYKALIGFCVAGALTSPLQAKAGDTSVRLSLTDAIMMARQNNYTIKAARSRIDQAEARVVQTRQSSLPKVTLSETLMVTNDPGAALVFKLQQSSIQAIDFMPDKLNNPNVINDFNTSLQVMQPLYNADAAIGRSIAEKMGSRRACEEGILNWRTFIHHCAARGVAGWRTFAS